MYAATQWIGLSCVTDQAPHQAKKPSSCAAPSLRVEAVMMCTPLGADPSVCARLTGRTVLTLIQEAPTGQHLSTTA